MGKATTAAGQKLLEDNITKSIKKAMFDRGLNADKVAEESLVSRPTFYKRLSNPSSLTVGEMYNIFHVLGIKFAIGEDAEKMEEQYVESIHR